VHAASANINPAAIPPQATERFVISFLLHKLPSGKPKGPSAAKLSISQQSRKPIRSPILTHGSYDWFRLNLPICLAALAATGIRLTKYSSGCPHLIRVKHGIAAIRGKFIVAIIGRRWTIAYALGGSTPGPLFDDVCGSGAIVFGGHDLSEHFRMPPRGRERIFGELSGPIFASVVTPFLWKACTASPRVFLGTFLVVVRSAPACHCSSAKRHRPAASRHRGASRTGLTRPARIER
jgi:hypothetical protein